MTTLGLLRSLPDTPTATRWVKLLAGRPRDQLLCTAGVATRGAMKSSQELNSPKPFVGRADARPL